MVAFESVLQFCEIFPCEMKIDKSPWETFQRYISVIKFLRFKSIDSIGKKVNFKIAEAYRLQRGKKERKVTVSGGMVHNVHTYICGQKA